MVRRLLVLIAVAISVGCAKGSPTAPRGPLNVQVTLAPGEAARVDGTSFRIVFQDVMGDSRCPATALCVWAGDAVVRVGIIDSSGQQSYDLHTNAQGGAKSAQHGDVTIALALLSPYPMSAAPIPRAEYRATVQIAR